MTVNQPPGLDGEGIYPHSYERLGAQRGFHISEVLYDSNWASTTPRNITIQAVCARGQIPQNPTPHKTVFILPGQTKSAIARCPNGQQLITGGFQRTNFASDGGNYVTESRAVGSQGVEGERQRLHRQRHDGRRRAHRDRLLLQEQEADPHRGLFGSGAGRTGSQRLGDHAEAARATFA